MYRQHYKPADRRLTKARTAVTELAEARVMKMSASLESAEPPPARSDRARIAMKGVRCWRQMRATEALSMSTGLMLNLS